MSRFSAGLVSLSMAGLVSQFSASLIALSMACLVSRFSSRLVPLCIAGLVSNLSTSIIPLSVACLLSHFSTGLIPLNMAGFVPAGPVPLSMAGLISPFSAGFMRRIDVRNCSGETCARGLFHKFSIPGGQVSNELFDIHGCALQVSPRTMKLQIQIN